MLSPRAAPSFSVLGGLAALCLAFLPAAGEPIPYWDLTPTFEPGQLTLFNETDGDGINGVPVRGVDLNGDGRDEVAMSGIRGDGPDETRDSAGEIHITFWDEEELTGFIDFAKPDPRVLTIYGAQPEEYLGICLAPGDVDDDGTPDLLIGAFGADPPGRENAGRVYVLFGDPAMTGGAVIDLADGIPPNMTSILGAEYDDRLGVWAATGDIDGDGAADLVLGSDRADGPGGTRPEAGKGVVLYGPIPRGVEIDLAVWPGRQTVIWGVEEDDHLGATVTCGDFDGDGYDDAAIAAASHQMSRNVYDSGGSGDGPPGDWRRDSGETWIVFGSPDLPDTVDLAAPGTTDVTVVYGRHRDARAGEELGTGDVNGDGVDDLLIGSLTSNGPPGDYRLNAGEGYVFFGAPGFRNQAIDLALDDYPRMTIHGKRGTITTDSFACGDINNDGYDDLLVGMPCDIGPHDRGAGVIVVVYGSGAPPAVVDLKEPAVPVTVLEGVDFDDNTAYWASSGDVNGDGYVDVIVNSMTADSYRNSRPVAGEARVVSGAWLTRHPAPPEEFRVVSNTEGGSVALAWTPSPTSSVTAYLLEWSRPDGSNREYTVLPASASSHTVAFLPNRMTCRFRIAALNGLYRSRHAPPVVSTPGSFPTPTNLRGTVLGKSRVLVEWDPVELPDLLGYVLYRWQDGETLDPDSPPFAVFTTEPFYEDEDPPSYTGVHYAVSAFSDTEAGPAAREIFQSDLSAPVRVYPHPLTVGQGLLVINDYDWFVYSDGSAPWFVGDPWEMYEAFAVTGSTPFEFWDQRTGFTTYPPGYVPLGNGPVDPEVLFEHGIAMFVTNGPDNSSDMRLQDQEELLLAFDDAGGTLVFLGRLLGSYLTPGLNTLFHVDDWDAPKTVSESKQLVPEEFASLDSIGPDSTAGVAVFSDVPEFSDTAAVRVLYRLDDDGAPPLFLEVSGEYGWPEAYLFSVNPSFLDPTELGTAMNILLDRLPGQRTSTSDPPPPRPRVGLVHPNPARGASQIEFQLTRPGPVEAAVVDVRGRRVKTLHSGFREAGTTRLQWDGFDTAGRRAAAGVYFLRVVSREFREARRVVLLP